MFSEIKTLAEAHTLGDLSKRYGADVFAFVLSRYQSNQGLPQHAHADSYVCLNLGNAFVETSCAWGSAEVAPLVAVSHPEGAAHGNSFGVGGGVCLSVFCEVPQSRFWKLATKSHRIAGGAYIRKLGELLSQELGYGSSHDSCTALSLAELSLQLIQGLSEKAGNANREHHRVSTALDAVRDDPAHAWTIRELANIASLHPTHLARQVRIVTGQTFGEHLRRRRIVAAINLLKADGSCLADVAARCGFSDQAHLSRTMKRLTGVTPGTLRAKR